MDVTEETIKHIASLAKLKFTDNEKEVFAEQLDTIIDMVETLDMLDTTDVPGTYHGIALENIYRADKAVDSDKRAALLDNAPSVKDGLIEVPAMIANGEEDA